MHRHPSATVPGTVRGERSLPARALFPLLPLLALAAPGQALQETDPPEEHRPAYSFLRQAEDWSRFRAADPPVDRFDSIKHIVLGEDVWLSLGGRLESRFENWNEFGAGAGPPGSESDENLVVSRILLHADLHVGEHLRVFLEGKSAQSTDRELPGGRRPLDMDTLEIQQAFVDIVLPAGEGDLTLRLGRQMLLLGAQRLVSPLPWGNALRHWEGITAELELGEWTFDALATAFVPVDKTEPNERDDDNLLWGLYASRERPGEKAGLELYLLGNERADVTVNGTSGDERRLTLGGRSYGPLGSGFDHDAEGGWQVGEVGDGDVSAWFLGSQLGWKPGAVGRDLPGDPRFFIGLDLGSGDDDPGGDVGTFHQLFPLGHLYLGYIDAIGRQNIFDLSAGGEWKVAPSTQFSAAVHHFRLLETEDALYDAGGNPSRSGFESKEVGTEVDLRVRRTFGPHIQAYAGYSHLFAGSALADSGPAEDVDFFYVGGSFTF